MTVAASRRTRPPARTASAAPLSSDAEAWWARHRAELRPRRAADSPSAHAHAPHWSTSPFDACA